MSEDNDPIGSSCPICGTAAIKRYRPFCSKRCADVDLSRWLGGTYSVPVVQLDESDVDELEKFIEGQNEN